MGDIEFLRRFHSWIGQIIEPANQFRIAARSDDLEELARLAAEFIRASDKFAAEFKAAKDYQERENEWWFQYSAWKHSGQHGQQPDRPEWPVEIPKFREALSAVILIATLRELAGDNIGDMRALTESSIAMLLREFISALNGLFSLIEIDGEKGQDGPINRDDLAKLVHVKPKTLANRARELPKPIARTSNNVPIYLFQQARHALREMYPEHAGMLPETYQEAVSRSE